jgi:hypothetical protein
LVLMRTRKPCVRRRRRRFGWNVRFMVFGSPATIERLQRNFDSSERPVRVSIAVPSGDRRELCSRVLARVIAGSGGAIVGDRTLCYSRAPAFGEPVPICVGSPPEVFHNCGKKCGKAPVFAPLFRPNAGVTPVSTRRRLKTPVILDSDTVEPRKRAVTTAHRGWRKSKTADLAASCEPR